MTDFKIGEYAVVEGLPFPQSIHNGTNCEILTCKGDWLVTNKGCAPMNVRSGYVTLLSNGNSLTVNEGCLKKSSRMVSFESSDTKHTWKDCSWKPQHLRGKV